MGNIWFFGDSYCDDASSGTWCQRLAYLTNKTVAHTGTPGTSIQAMLQSFLENVDYITKDDIVVFVYTTFYRNLFNGKHYRPIDLSAARPDDVNNKLDAINQANNNNLHGLVGEDELNAYARYHLHLWDREEEEQRAGVMCNYLINYKLPCPVLHIPAFADFPKQYATLPFEPAKAFYIENTFCLADIIDQFINDTGIDPHLVKSKPNHMGTPLTKTDAVPHVMEYIDQYLNASMHKHKRNK